MSDGFNPGLLKGFESATEGAAEGAGGGGSPLGLLAPLLGGITGVGTGVSTPSQSTTGGAVAPQSYNYGPFGLFQKNIPGLVGAAPEARQPGWAQSLPAPQAPAPQAVSPLPMQLQQQQPIQNHAIPAPQQAPASSPYAPVAQAGIAPAPAVSPQAMPQAEQAPAQGSTEQSPDRMLQGSVSEDVQAQPQPTEEQAPWMTQFQNSMAPAMQAFHSFLDDPLGSAQHAMQNLPDPIAALSQPTAFDLANQAEGKVPPPPPMTELPPVQKQDLGSPGMPPGGRQIAATLGTQGLSHNQSDLLKAAQRQAQSLANAGQHARQAQQGIEAARMTTDPNDLRQTGLNLAQQVLNIGAKSADEQKNIATKNLRDLIYGMPGEKGHPANPAAGIPFKPDTPEVKPLIRQVMDKYMAPLQAKTIPVYDSDGHALTQNDPITGKPLLDPQTGQPIQLMESIFDRQKEIDGALRSLDVEVDKLSRRGVPMPSRDTVYQHLQSSAPRVQPSGYLNRLFGPVMGSSEDMSEGGPAVDRHNNPVYDAHATRYNPDTGRPEHYPALKINAPSGAWQDAKRAAVNQAAQNAAAQVSYKEALQANLLKERAMYDTLAAKAVAGAHNELNAVYKAMSDRLSAVKDANNSFNEQQRSVLTFMGAMSGNAAQQAKLEQQLKYEEQSLDNQKLGLGNQQLELGARLQELQNQHTKQDATEAREQQKQMMSESQMRLGAIAKQQDEIRQRMDLLSKSKKPPLDAPQQLQRLQQLDQNLLQQWSQEQVRMLELMKSSPQQQQPASPQEASSSQPEI